MSSIFSKLINLAGNITGTLGVGNGGTGLASGTSGGVLAFTGSTTLASSGALAANGVVLGGGAGAAPTSTAAGTVGQLLVGVTGSAPAWGNTVSGAKTWQDVQTWQYSGGTAAGSYDTSGQWTLGPASGSAAHAVQSGGITTFAVSSGGTSLQRLNLTNGATINWQFEAANAGTLTLNNSGGTLATASVTQAGIWTLGPTSGSGTSATHLIRGQATAGNQQVTVQKTGVASGTASNYYMAFRGATTDDGYLWYNAGSTLALVNASDARLKVNVRDADYGLATVMRLRPRTFDWASGAATNCKGFIAQEVLAVLPESVAITDQSKQGGLADQHYLEMQTMIPVLVKAVQELKRELDQLKAERAPC